MTKHRDPDALLSAYLTDGMEFLSDRVVDAVLDEVHRTRQRVVFGPWTTRPMVRPALGAAAVVALVVLGGAFFVIQGSRPAVVGPSPTADASSRASQPAVIGPSASPTASDPAGRPLVLTFTARNFDGGLAVRVPAGWRNTAEEYFTYELVGPAGPAAGSITVHSESLLATNGNAGCAASPNAGMKITAGLAADPRLVSSGPTPITVGGREGEMLDLRLAPDWTADCPWSDGQPAAVLLTRSHPPREMRISGKEHMRLIVIEYSRGCCSNVIAIHAPDEAAFNAFLAQAMRIVDAFEFGGGG